MIKSLVLKGKYSIDVDQYERIEVDGKKLSLKDIPYVRYVFDCYDDDTIEYIKNSIKKFKYSVHIADVTFGVDAKNTVAKLNEVFNTENMELFTMLIIPVTDEMVAGEITDAATLDMLTDLSDEDITRYVLRDNPNNIKIMSVLELSNLKKLIIRTTGCKESDISICGSQFSKQFGCLRASFVRELQTYKSEDIEVPLVPEGHEGNGDYCGCTRYSLVTSDIKVTMSETTVKEKKSSEKSSEPKKVKAKFTYSGVAF